MPKKVPVQRPAYYNQRINICYSRSEMQSFDLPEGDTGNMAHKILHPHSIVQTFISSVKL